MFASALCSGTEHNYGTNANTVRSRYKRQLIQFKMIKKWPTWSGMEDSRPIFSCKRFSYNENALYSTVQHFAVFPILADVIKVETGSGSTAHWSVHFFQLNGWLRHSLALLVLC